MNLLSKFQMKISLAGILVGGAIFAIAPLAPPAAHAQATISTGSIQGTVLDPRGATVPSATVTLTSKATGAKQVVPVTQSGEFNFAGLTPGVYDVRIGAFGRSIQGTNGLVNTLNNYNTTFANQPTPAGQTLISNGLFTVSQLQGLSGVAPFIPLPPTGQVSTYGLRAFDLRLDWVYHLMERFTIEPGVSFYNVFNFANFDLPQTMISGVLNGTTYSQQVAQCVGVGTGVYSLGAPRAIEWGLKFTF